METAVRSHQPHELIGGLMEHTGWSLDQLAAYQRTLLDDLLRHATQTSPFYRRQLGGDPVGARLDELPTLSKATLMAYFDEIVADPALHLAQLREHLAGPSGNEPLHDHLIMTTSGSTGQPGIFVYSREDLAPWAAGLMRAMTLFGVTPPMRMAGLGSPSGMHISRHLVAALLAGRPSNAPRTSNATPMPELVETFNRYQPEVIAGYTSMQALLAEEHLAGRLRIAPHVIAYAGEVLTVHMRSRIREAWDVEPLSLYSATEAGIIASGCTAHVGMHLWEDLVLVEVVDEHDRPVPPGVPGHRVLVTNLVNRTQPLIRYEITDLVTMAEGPNPTGMPFRRIADISGRSDDIAHLPALRGGTVAIPPSRLRAAMATVPELLQYQIVVGLDAIRTSVVLRSTAPVHCDQQIRASLHSALLDAGAAPPPILITVVDAVERCPSGKLKTVIVAS
jgi:phenylacetate-CoA ligase